MTLRLLDSRGRLAHMDNMDEHLEQTNRGWQANSFGMRGKFENSKKMNRTFHDFTYKHRFHPMESRTTCQSRGKSPVLFFLYFSR